MNGGRRAVLGRIDAGPSPVCRAGAVNFVVFRLVLRDCGVRVCVNVRGPAATLEPLRSRLVPGTTVAIEGRRQITHWTGQDGVRRACLSLDARTVRSVTDAATMDGQRPGGTPRCGEGVT